MMRETFMPWHLCMFVVHCCLLYTSAGRIRSLYRTGDPEAGPAAFTAAAIGLKDAQRIYAPYLWYLQSEGVLDKALDSQLSQTATRAQMAHVLANLQMCIRDSTCPEQSATKNTSLPCKFSCPSS